MRAALLPLPRATADHPSPFDENARGRGRGEGRDATLLKRIRINSRIRNPHPQFPHSPPPPPTCTIPPDPVLRPDRITADPHDLLAHYALGDMPGYTAGEGSPVRWLRDPHRGVHLLAEVDVPKAPAPLRLLPEVRAPLRHGIRGGRPRLRQPRPHRPHLDPPATCRGLLQPPPPRFCPQLRSLAGWPTGRRLLRRPHRRLRQRRVDVLPRQQRQQGRLRPHAPSTSRSAASDSSTATPSPTPAATTAKSGSPAGSFERLLSHAIDTPVESDRRHARPRPPRGPVRRMLPVHRLYARSRISSPAARDGDIDRPRN